MLHHRRKRMSKCGVINAIHTPKPDIYFRSQYPLPVVLPCTGHSIRHENAVEALANSTSTIVGRHPIFTPDMDVFGYELLFRNADHTARFTCGEQATARVLVSTLLDLGLDVVADSKNAFFNLTRETLLRGDLSCIPPDQSVLEILEDIEPDDEVLEAIQDLSSRGYRIALDDFVFSTKLIPLIELADIVKLELPQISKSELPDQIAQLRELGVKSLLAEKVETQDEFELCKELGCDLFQGFFFCRPQIVEKRRPKNNCISIIQLVAKLQEPSITIPQVTKVIQSDVNLSYRILRFINSARFGFAMNIDSIEHAAILLGLDRLRSIASMVLMASLDEGKPVELTKTAMLRARMCEQVARGLGYETPERFFTLGIFSLLDAILDSPMEEVVQQLPFSTEMKSALVNHVGRLGQVLKQVIELEGNQSPASILPSDTYAQALKWNASLSKLQSA